MLALKICPVDWKRESRDKRELSVYQELGAETLVVTKGGSRDYGREDCVDGFRVRRLTTRPVSCFPLSLNRILSLFYWAHYTRNLQADVISGHDLGGLAIGWMSNWFSRKKAALIYDSHEFEIGRNTKRTAVQKWFVAHLERFLMNRCVFSIMVNDSIADEVQRIRSEKHRVRELGDRPMLSGLLFCADCGKRMYQIRSKSRSHDQEYFECSTYRKGRGCSSHHIKNTEAIAALLDQIQAVSRFVKADENSFINRVAAQSKSSAEKDLKQNKRSLSLIEERILSLDQIIRQLYEDNLKGKITDQRFQKLSQDYENEQKELEQKVTCLKESISAARNTANNTAEFIKAVRAVAQYRDKDLMQRDHLLVGGKAQLGTVDALCQLVELVKAAAPRLYILRNKAVGAVHASAQIAHDVVVKFVL